MTAPALVAEEIARFLSEKREIATDTGGRHDPAGADSRS